MTEQSEAIRKEQLGKAGRLAEARRNGTQLSPAEYTKYIGEQQGGGEVLEMRRFTVDNRKIMRRIRNAIRTMERQNAIDVDKIHAEMLQTAPVLFERVLTKLWEVVSSVLMVHREWTTGVLVPLHKKGTQSDPAKYRPLCMLSHVRKILEQALTAELETVMSTDRIQYGFQNNLITLQAALYITAAVEAEIGQLLSVLDQTKAYNIVIRKLLVDKLIAQGIPDKLVNKLIVFLLTLLVSTEGDLTGTVSLLTKGLVQGSSFRDGVADTISFFHQRFCRRPESRCWEFKRAKWTQFSRPSETGRRRRHTDRTVTGGAASTPRRMI